MSVDGFSIANFNLPKDITSAQAAATAEQVVFTGNEKVVGKIDKALNKKINNDEEKGNQNKFFEDAYEESKDENEDEEENDESGIDKDKRLSTKSAKRYKNLVINDPENVVIKINNKTDKIELYNKSTNKILESIKAQDFLDMINKLDYNSGIMVNLNI